MVIIKRMYWSYVELLERRIHILPKDIGDLMWPVLTQYFTQLGAWPPQALP